MPSITENIFFIVLSFTDYTPYGNIQHTHFKDVATLRFVQRNVLIVDRLNFSSSGATETMRPRTCSTPSTSPGPTSSPYSSTSLGPLQVSLVVVAFTVVVVAVVLFLFTDGQINVMSRFVLYYGQSDIRLILVSKPDIRPNIRFHLPDTGVRPEIRIFL